MTDELHQSLFRPSPLPPAYPPGHAPPPLPPWQPGLAPRPPPPITCYLERSPTSFTWSYGAGLFPFMILGGFFFLLQASFGSGARPFFTQFLHFVSLVFAAIPLGLTITMKLDYAECGVGDSSMVITIVASVWWALSFWWGRRTIRDYRVALKEIEGDLPARLKDGTVLLLRVDWLLAQDESFRLKRRQLTPKEAFWGPNEAAKLLEQGKVAALSYRWLKRWRLEHTDPDVNDGEGYALSHLLAYYEKGSRRHQRPAVYIDFACLPQGDPSKRFAYVEEDAKACFDRAFAVNFNLYASPRVLVLQLKSMPDDMKEMLKKHGGSIPPWPKEEAPFELDLEPFPQVIDLKPYAGAACRSGWCTSEIALTLLFTEGGGHAFELGPHGGPVRVGRARDRPTFDKMVDIFKHETTLFGTPKERQDVSTNYLELRKKVDRLQAVRRTFFARMCCRESADVKQLRDRYVPTIEKADITSAPLTNLPACFKYTQPAGCGINANRKHPHATAKVAPQSEEPEPKRTWLQWARSNDGCFTDGKCCYTPYTCGKWLAVGCFAGLLIFIHLLGFLVRFVLGGAFRKGLALEWGIAGGRGTTDGVTFAYYLIAGVPMLIDYCLAFGEMMALFGFLVGAYWMAFGFSAAFACGVFCGSPWTGADAVVEVMAISAGIYKRLEKIFGNAAPDHPCKLFGFKVDFTPYTKPGATVSAKDSEYAHHYPADKDGKWCPDKDAVQRLRTATLQFVKPDPGDTLSVSDID